MSGDGLNDLARAAAAGDRDALADVAARVRDPVYRMALRFLGHPQDAEDAAQEILIRVITHLDSFEGRSQLMTWVYTITFRHLLRARKGFAESSVRGAETFAQVLDGGLADRDYTAEEAEFRLLCEEVRLSCTYGMLLCLTRPARVAYILGDVLGMPDTQGAAVCEISPAAFRQRLARARKTLRAVIDNRCGLVSPDNPCRCARQIDSSIQLGILDREKLLFAAHPRSTGLGPAPAERARLQRAAEQLNAVLDIAQLYRAAPEFTAPERLWNELERALPDLLGSSRGG